MFALRKAPNALSATFKASAKPPTSAAFASAAQVSKNAETGSSDASTRTGRRFRKKSPPQRPQIDSAHPRKWCRPLGAGVVPAYDTALQYLRQDSAQVKSEADALRGQVEAKEAKYQELKAQAEAKDDSRLMRQLDALNGELEAMLKKLNILEVQSEVNLPDVRWSVDNAMADMTKPSHRHLSEQKWRKDGDLDLLMERIYQMKVVPDVLPEINPGFDLRVAARNTALDIARTKKVYAQVEPGVFLKPEQTRVPPKLFGTVFHTDVRLYTMVLVDLDVPSPETQGFTTYLHWLQPNIPLSAMSHAPIENPNTHTRYIPPHPQRGSPYHRYVCLLLPQPPIGASEYTRAMARRATGPTSEHLDIPVVPDSERLGFDVREFASRWNLNGSNGGGAHMWREVWDETVSGIYKNVLKTEEPKFGRPPKVDVYAEFKQKRYIS